MERFYNLIEWGRKSLSVLVWAGLVLFVAGPVLIVFGWESAMMVGLFVSVAAVCVLLGWMLFAGVVIDIHRASRRARSHRASSRVR